MTIDPASMSASLPMGNTTFANPTLDANFVDPSSGPIPAAAPVPGVQANLVGPGAAVPGAMPGALPNAGVPGAIAGTPMLSTASALVGPGAGVIGAGPTDVASQLGTITALVGQVATAVQTMMGGAAVQPGMALPGTLGMPQAGMDPSMMGLPQAGMAPAGGPMGMAGAQTCPHAAANAGMPMAMPGAAQLAEGDLVAGGDPLAGLSQLELPEEDAEAIDDSAGDEMNALLNDTEGAGEAEGGAEESSEGDAAGGGEGEGGGGGLGGLLGGDGLDGIMNIFGKVADSGILEQAMGAIGPLIGMLGGIGGNGGTPDAQELSGDELGDADAPADGAPTDDAAAGGAPTDGAPAPGTPPPPTGGDALPPPLPA